MTQFEEYMKMARASDLQRMYEGRSIDSFSAQDFIEVFTNNSWVMADILQELARLCMEEYALAKEDPTLEELLLVLLERSIYNKEWNGKKWVGV